jgi:glycosyltransferase involved in cell wall biosynthesis
MIDMPGTGRRLRVLMMKGEMGWPRVSGHDVHCFNMMKALSDLGHEVGLLTAKAPAPEAIEDVPLSFMARFSSDDAPRDARLPGGLTWLQERYRSYYGAEAGLLAQVRQALQTFAPDAVVVGGLNLLPYFTVMRDVVSVWYAADELALHHLTQVHVTSPATWTHVREACVEGLYERAYAPLMDRAWVVSDSEQRAMQRLAGVRAVDVLPNGVDGTMFSPSNVTPEPHTAVFWGRLDFGPNIQALQWFCGEVWPLVRQRVADARFTIVGFHPTDAVRALASSEGISLLPNLADLREEVCRHAVVVLPFVSGGGIKNKLLEAAAMARPIVCTPRACEGLRGLDAAPIRVARGRVAMAETLIELWGNAQDARTLGARARQWVLTNHSWSAVGAAAADILRDAVAERERVA